MVLYPNKLPESERVCSGICTNNIIYIRVVICFHFSIFEPLETADYSL